ncbi:N-6 DNA methylase [Lactiplantibacillus plantarum]|uniref:N-6 DNA methylase n=1 Tax=Lactiplantibacillus plantarum TaxID=1590 RepID=UPI001BABD90D|nr:N-6 DNA methylase [Lactiplantibacillus plantarum]MBS0955449.1 N-6 DNA methylase [Lactiplantibacillus plantarum]
MADIKPWLSALKFDDDNCLTINGNTIEIDFENEKINYPNLKEIGRSTTINFSDEENFVVLECVIRLLKQGYAPSQISLEKSYKLGHNTKSGNADITVEDNSLKPFLIIETKTYGDEFDKEWCNTINDGGQLFSYDKQENKATVLALYESKVNANGLLDADYRAITLKDNEEYLSTLENVRGYKDAVGGNDRFDVWKKTYQCEYTTNGILEPDIQPFTVGKPKKTITDLKEITHEKVQPKYNEFATILRKYNISGHENAFDKLVNLFLAKIVDEQQNQDDLQFNWKGLSQDSYFDLVDRLQKLYTVGMEKFLNETVSYVSENDIVNSFRLRKDAAKDAILEYFKALKYFSDNDFTFLEVYNEQLFFQNSKILVEVVQMLQDMKLRTNQQNQFLGDLFEGYLDNGIKQSEGQFFTPLPIVKFIVSSLPLVEINNQTDIPKVIDYACGSGHFLNEYAEEIKSLVPESQLTDYYSEIYGIEKEYRLSKVSKLSAFMYGQDKINIIYGDSLDQHDRVKDDNFSVIVANPPYSVKGFLETLPKEQRNTYHLIKYIDKLETNNNIELFFLERAKQLLKSEGVAGIIFPSSVLSNTNVSNVYARKLLLENFNIIGIAEFGSKTFGATGTNTVTLFLRKKKYPPEESLNYKYAVDRWFNNSDDLLQEDKELIQNYCDHMGYDFDVYQELQTRRLNQIFNIELFVEYKEEFSKNAFAKKILKKKISSKYTDEMKNEEYANCEVTYIWNIEKEKVLYFSIANSQTNSVVIVRSPKENSDIQKFLGYKWSKRKGSEGIQYIGTRVSKNKIETSTNLAINSIQTPLFNPLSSTDSSKINSVIRDNFNGKLGNIPDSLENFVSKMDLADMLDFTQSDFDAQIQTIKQGKIEIHSKYPVKRLGDVIDLKIGGTPSRDNNAFFQGNNLWVSIAEMSGDPITDTKEKITDDAVNQSNVKLIPKGTTLLSFKLSVGRTAIAGKDLYTNEAIAGLIPKNNELKDRYIFIYFKSGIVGLDDVSANKAFGKSLNSEFLKKKVPIPLPPLDIQDKIIEETEKLDQQYKTSRMKFVDYQDKIKDIFESLDVIREDV